MANPEHLKILQEALDKKNIEIWNTWRKTEPDLKPDLTSANLSKAELVGVDFRNANLSEAKLNWSLLSGADLTGANLYRTELHGANLYQANLARANLRCAGLSGADLGLADLCSANLKGATLFASSLREAELMSADLREANLAEANLVGSDLSRAKLAKANLSKSTLVNTTLDGANLDGCWIYGISVWNLKISQETEQFNLVITTDNEPVITVDNLEVAQFIYLLLHNEKIRHVIDTITSKVVLILGSFTEERKAVLDAIRDELRKRDYLPVVFDFDKPASKDLTETISTLAHMARFIIADITEPKCIPHELATIVPALSVPVKPLLLKGSTGEYAMFKDLRQKYHWVLAVYRYKNSDELIEALEPKVILPAEKKAKALIKRKSR